MSAIQIPGVVMAGTVPQEPPTLLVIGPPKYGKSTLAASLIGWPEPGMMPLVLAFDPTGPDSCASIGMPVPMMKIRDLAGATWMDRTRTALNTLEGVFRGKKAPFGSLVVDCASTMIERLHEDATRNTKNPDPRAAYGVILEQSKEILSRIHDLGVPTVWLSWMRESYIEESGEGAQKKRRQVLGGPLITGNFRARLAGTVHMITILDKINVGPGAPGADAQGYQRVLHTRTWSGIEAGGRYVLPEPFPANLGLMMDAILRRGQFAAAPAAPADAVEAP